MPPTHTNSAETTGVLQVLLGEQKHIDAQIETMMDLQIKLLAVLFPAVAAAAGWLFGTDEKRILPLLDGFSAQMKNAFSLRSLKERCF